MDLVKREEGTSSCHFFYFLLICATRQQILLTPDVTSAFLIKAAFSIVCDVSDFPNPKAFYPCRHSLFICLKYLIWLQKSVKS